MSSLVDMVFTEADDLAIAHLMSLPNVCLLDLTKVYRIDFRRASGGRGTKKIYLFF